MVGDSFVFIFKLLLVLLAVSEVIFSNLVRSKSGIYYISIIDDILRETFLFFGGLIGMTILNLFSRRIVITINPLKNGKVPRRISSIIDI